MNWFGRPTPSTAVPESALPVTINLPAMPPAVDLLTVQRLNETHQVTIDEVEDDQESLSPSEQEEEGLGDLEEIFALTCDAPPRTPCPPRNPTPPVHFPIPSTSSHVTQLSAGPSPSPNRQYAASPISFTPADQSFDYTPVA
jgi:hypothetical protein